MVQLVALHGIFSEFCGCSLSTAVLRLQASLMHVQQCPQQMFWSIASELQWRRHISWQRAETYLLLVFDIVYCATALMLFFGWFQLCWIVCGKRRLTHSTKLLVTQHVKDTVAQFHAN